MLYQSSQKLLNSAEIFAFNSEKKFTGRRRGGFNLHFYISKSIHKTKLLELGISVYFKIILFLFKNILNDTRDSKF